ncbi:MAG: hypothetical protein AAGF20_02975 [Pseudomonadota bacterium]
MNIWILAAAGLSAVTTLIHFFAGGREIARPLLDADDLQKIAKLTNYFCWHLITLVLAAITTGFVYIAYHPNELALLIGLSVLCLLFAVLNAGIILRYRVSPLLMPQWLLLGGMGVLGFTGYWGL